MDKLKNRMTVAAVMVILLAYVAISVGAVGIRPEAEDKPTYQPELTAMVLAAPAAVTAIPSPTPTPETTPAPEPEETPEPAPEADKPAYTYYDVPLADDLQEYTQDLCAEYSFPHYDVLVALMGHESSYRETVVSETNDHGMMQINACNHEWLREELGVTDFYDARQNILCGIHILAGHYEEYGDIGLALMAYNCGPKGASDLWAQGIYSTSYSRSILQEAQALTVRPADGGQAQ